MANTWRQRAKKFVDDLATDIRFKDIELQHAGGNVMAVTGRVSSEQDFAALLELGRRAGFIVLADRLFIPAT